MLGGVAVFCAGSLIGALATARGHADRGPGRDGRRRGRLRARDALADPADLPDRAARRARALGVWTSVSGHLARRRARARRPARRARRAGAASSGSTSSSASSRSRRRRGRCRRAPTRRAGRSTCRASSRASSRSRRSPFAVIEGENAGLHHLVDRRPVRPRRRSRPSVFVLDRAAHRRSGRPARVLPDPRLSQRERRRLRNELRPLRGLLLHRAVPAGGLEVLRRRRSRSSSSRWRSRWSLRARSPAAGRRREARAGRWPSAASSPAAGMFASTRCSAPTSRSDSSPRRSRSSASGSGSHSSPSPSAVLSIVPPERSGMAASTVNTSRELGGVLAVAILGAVINGRLVSDLNSKLAGLGVPDDLQQLVVARRHPRRSARRTRRLRSSRTRSSRRRRSCIRGSSARCSTRPTDVVRPRPARRPRRRRGDPPRRAPSSRSSATSEIRRQPDQADGGGHATNGLLEQRARRAEVEPREARGPARRSVGPGLSATLPRSRNASDGSSPSPSSRQSSQAR